MGASESPDGSGRRFRLAAATSGCALALLLVAACGGSTGTTGATPSVAPSGLPSGLPTALPTGLPTSLPGGAQVTSGNDALKGANVPAGFPIPPGAKVENGASSGNRSTVTLSGVSATEMATFYRKALPAAGYTITGDNQIAGLARISFQGHGVTGDIDAAGIGSSNGVLITFHKQ